MVHSQSGEILYIFKSDDKTQLDTAVSIEEANHKIGIRYM